MSEVVVVCSFTAKPGKEREALEAFRALVAPSYSESGCILYALHQRADDPRRLPSSSAGARARNPTRT
jgi:quinol monooxygenase YgiN